MYTKHHFLSLFILLTGISFLSNACVYSNGGFGPDVEEERPVGDFDGIRVSSGIDVKLSQGREARLIIIADEDLIDDVESEVVNGTLELSVDRNWFRRGNVEALITFVDIELLDVSAGSDVESDQLLKFGKIEIKASSGSDIELSLEASDISLRVSSGSDAELEGRSGKFYAKATSGSDIDAYDLETTDAVLELSSGSDVKIRVTGSLEVNATSGSDVHYRGEPEVVNINTSSGADVTKR